MNLAEACKLAKNLENFKYELSKMFQDRNYTSKITETHFRSKVAEELTDEVLEKEIEKKYDITVEDIVTLLELVMTKKAMLSSAIENAKHSIKIKVNGTEVSYDSAVEYNKSLRSFAIAGLSTANRYSKPTVSKTQSYGYKLDVEGKQTRYVYDMEVKTEPTFDTSLTKTKEKEYRKMADKISVALDEAKLATKIELDLGIEVTDTLEDVIEKFLTK